MKRLVLIRHGETEHNAGHIIQGWQNPGLNEAGKSQVREAARTINEIPGVIFASDLRRAVESADIIRSELGFETTPMLLDWRLRERSFGTAEGKSRDEVDMDAFYTADPDERLYDAESETQFTQRVWSFVQGLSAIETDTILISTHSGTLNRFGYILCSDFEFVKYENAAIVNYDIDLSNIENEWEKKRGNH